MSRDMWTLFSVTHISWGLSGEGELAVSFKCMSVMLTKVP